MRIPRPDSDPLPDKDFRKIKRQLRLRALFSAVGSGAACFASPIFGGIFGPVFFGAIQSWRESGLKDLRNVPDRSTFAPQAKQLARIGRGSKILRRASMVAGIFGCLAFSPSGCQNYFLNERAYNGVAQIAQSYGFDMKPLPTSAAENASAKGPQSFDLSR